MEEIDSTIPEPLPAVSAEELLPADEPQPESPPRTDSELRAVLEAIVYVTEEPLTKAQISSALGVTPELVATLLAELTAEYEKPEHGLAIREIAGGYKMATKAEHHDAVRAFVKSLKAALEAVAAGARDAGRDRLQTAGHRSGSDGDSRRAGSRRTEDAARKKADRRRRP